jgi:hypothetical protein
VTGLVAFIVACTNFLAGAFVALGAFVIFGAFGAGALFAAAFGLVVFCSTDRLVLDWLGSLKSRECMWCHRARGEGTI